MSNYKVEKGVPMPSKSCFPFGEMEVGDSFLIPLDGNSVHKTQMKVIQAARSYSSSIKGIFNIKTRKTEEGVRVFRIG